MRSSPLLRWVGLGDADHLLFEVEILPVSAPAVRPPGCRTSRASQSSNRKPACPSPPQQSGDTPLRPDAHLAALFLADGACHPGRILRQLVETHGMIEDGAELIVERFQIGLGIGLAVRASSASSSRSASE